MLTNGRDLHTKEQIKICTPHFPYIKPFYPVFSPVYLFTHFSLDVSIAFYGRYKNVYHRKKSLFTGISK